VIAVCMSPNCERWHSSKTMTTCPSKIACPLLAAMKVESFWIVVMMIVAVGVLQLLLELDARRGVGVGRALLEAVVLLHRLVVEVLAVDDEEHLVDRGHRRRELCGLEARQRLP
jgi:hypothetical protein